MGNIKANMGANREGLTVYAAKDLEMVTKLERCLTTFVKRPSIPEKKKTFTVGLKNRFEILKNQKQGGEDVEEKRCKINSMEEANSFEYRRDNKSWMSVVI